MTTSLQRVLAQLSPDQQEMLAQSDIKFFDGEELDPLPSSYEELEHWARDVPDYRNPMVMGELVAERGWPMKQVHDQVAPSEEQPALRAAFMLGYEHRLYHLSKLAEQSRSSADPKMASWAEAFLFGEYGQADTRLPGTYELNRT